MRPPRLSPPRRTVAFGHWRFDLAGDELVGVRFRSRAILRGIRGVIRDYDWRTLTPEITQSTDSSNSHEFETRLSVRYAGWGQSYTGAVTIAVRGDSLRVDFHGRAEAAFRANRIGLVVLHEPDDAGSEVTVVSPSAGRSAARFPTDISPHQPLMNIAGLEWHRDGVNIRLEFAGDVFETEDQRNWTDASFKTYGTPLAQPFPVEHPPGCEVRQSVTVWASEATSRADAGTEAAPAESGEPTPVVVQAEAAGRVPPIGVAYPAKSRESRESSDTHEAPGVVDAASERVHSVRPRRGLESLLVELDGPIESRGARFADASALAERLGAPVDLRIVAADPSEVAATLDAVNLVRVCRIAVYDPATHVTEPPLWNALRSEAARLGFAGELVAGARAHFTELNRTVDRLPEDAAGVTFSITPQMHAREVERVVQTLPMQALVLENAQRLAGERPLHVGPVTLRARFNAVATTPGGLAVPSEDASDALQSDAFTAAWTLGSVAALSGRPVASVSYFETSGPGGIDANDGTPYPVGRLLRALAPLAGAEVLRVSPHDERLVVYPVRTADALTVFVANLRDAPRDLRIALPAGVDARGPRVEDFAAAEADVRPAQVGPGEGPAGDLLRIAMDRFTALAVTLPVTPQAEGSIR